MTVFGGDIIYAADLNDVEAKTYRKAAATARSSTITSTDDPELSGIPLAIGTYDIEMIIFFTVAGTTPKLATNWGFTGTMPDVVRLCHGQGSGSTAAPDAITSATLRGYSALGQQAIYNASTSAAYSAVLEIAYGVVITAAGNLSLQWAQSVSNASAVTVQAFSAVRVRKIP